MALAEVFLCGGDKHVEFNKPSVTVAYAKVKSTIESCVTPAQIDGAGRMFDNFHRMFPHEDRIYDILRKLYGDKSYAIHTGITPVNLTK